MSAHHVHYIECDVIFFGFTKYTPVCVCYNVISLCVCLFVSLFSGTYDSMSRSPWCNNKNCLKNNVCETKNEKKKNLSIWEMNSEKKIFLILPTRQNKSPPQKKNAFFLFRGISNCILKTWWCKLFSMFANMQYGVCVCEKVLNKQQNISFSPNMNGIYATTTIYL